MKREIKLNREDALIELETLINCFDVIDMSADVAEKTDNDEKKGNVLDKDLVLDPILWGLMHNYIQYNQEDQSITQKLINPIKYGEKTINELTYSTPLNATQAGKLQHRAKEVMIDFTNSVICKLVKKNLPLIEKLTINDMKIASAISALFLL